MAVLRTFVLGAHSQSRSSAAAYMQTAPAGAVVVVKDPARTLAQNSKIHPTVHDLAEMLGRPTDTESLRKLRYLLLEQWMHETDRPPQFERSFDGQRWVSVNKGTSDLEKPDCSEFIEWLEAKKAEVS